MRCNSQGKNPKDEILRVENKGRADQKCWHGNKIVKEIFSRFSKLFHIPKIEISSDSLFKPKR
jgi:hypothetical protein